MLLLCKTAEYQTSLHENTAHADGLAARCMLYIMFVTEMQHDAQYHGPDAGHAVLHQAMCVEAGAKVSSHHVLCYGTA